MPDPHPHPELDRIRRVARRALIAGVVIMALKFGVFALTNSAAVLSDAAESIVNLVAAGFMMFSLWFANRPADRDHPYGHGKIEFMAVGLEGSLILTAGVLIAIEAMRRMVNPPELDPGRVTLGVWLMAGVALLAAALAAYVWSRGKLFQNHVLIADGKHLATDVASTLAGILGLVLVRVTGHAWFDPAVALLIAGVIFFTSWRLLSESVAGLMDRSDPADEAVIKEILDAEVAAGTIRGYHKVRHRHTGSFHWIDMHIQVDPDLTVRQSHALASRIEHQIETRLHPGNATAHVEPAEG
ncbi:MAG: cation diffusion facilitator family transporter [Planctomycetes bacterium]|nr:cation diffusion facilitator family transporter [Planctomycetota bacterium]